MKNLVFLSNVFPFAWRKGSVATLSIVCVLLFIALGCEQKQPVSEEETGWCDFFDDQPPIPQEVGCDCEECKNEMILLSSREKSFVNHLLLNDWLHVVFYPDVTNAQMIEYLNKTCLFKPVDKDNFQYSNTVWVNTKKPTACVRLREIIQLLEKSPIVECANLTFERLHIDPVLIGENRNIATVANEFIVKVKDPDDLADLYAVAQETNTHVTRELFEGIVWLRGNFSVKVDKHSKLNAYLMPLYFLETEKFESTASGGAFHYVNR